jgi:hypothetical protein
MPTAKPCIPMDEHGRRLGRTRQFEATGERSLDQYEKILTMKSACRAVVEMGFIVFLFYANLLMGEFERSGLGRQRGFAWALTDIFTAANLAIAAVASLMGYLLFEFLRKRL